MSDEVFRGVNKYLCYTTGAEYLEYTPTYDSTGPARAMATRLRHNYMPAKKYKVKTVRRDGDAYEYVSTWCERAKEWERI